MKRTAVQSLDCHLSHLPFEEKILMIEQLRDLLFEHEMDAILESSEGPVQTYLPFCPKCGSVHIQRFGKRDGKQRYRCADCNRTFTERRKRSLIGSSNLSKGVWMRYINCFADGLTIAKCAANCGVSIQTAYTMRLRILELIAQTQESWKLAPGCRAQIDETFVYESFKGNRTMCKDFDMPRPAYQRGRKTEKSKKRASGMSSADHLCIVTGVDEQRRTFLQLGGRGYLQSNTCMEVLAPKLAKGSYVSTDEHKSYVGVLIDLKVHHAQFVSTFTEGSLNGVNSLHSHLKTFIARKRGVSSRRLPLYLAEFAWRWQACMNDNSTSKTSEKIIRKIAKTDFQPRVKSFKTSEYPYLEWWISEEGEKEKKRAELTAVQHGINKARYEAQGDPELESVVEERQKALDELVKAAGVNVRGNKESVKTQGIHQKRKTRLTLSMLRSE